MRSLVYFVATTLDGRIADADGGFDFFGFEQDYLRGLAEDWADGFPTAALTALGIEAPLTAWDTVVMGRATFAPAIEQGVADPYAHLRTIVYSTSLDPTAHPAVEVVASDPVEHVRGLKREAGGNLWLCGGGTLAATLSAEIDRLVLKINPVTIGAGVPLFGDDAGLADWRLVSHRVFDSGVIVAEYDRVR